MPPISIGKLLSAMWNVSVIPLGMKMPIRVVVKYFYVTVTVICSLKIVLLSVSICLTPGSSVHPLRNLGHFPGSELYEHFVCGYFHFSTFFLFIVGLHSYFYYFIVTTFVFVIIYMVISILIKVFSTTIIVPIIFIFPIPVFL